VDRIVENLDVLSQQIFKFKCQFIINLLLDYRFDYFQIFLTDI